MASPDPPQITTPSTPSDAGAEIISHIMVEGKRLKVTDSFVYLGSTLSRDGTLDAEEVLCASAAASNFK